MRKAFATLLFLALATSMIAINKKVITLSFDPKEYPVTLDKQGAAMFSSAVRPLIFKEEPHMPGIPYIPVTILIAGNEHYKGISYTAQDYTLYENALVYDNPMPFPTNGEAKETEPTITYPEGIYPAENVEFKGESTMDGYRLLRFMVCPYSYDSQTGLLTLKKSISLTLELEGEEAQVIGGRNMRDVVSSIVENPEELEALYLAPNSNIDNRTSQCRYLIITSQSLTSSFEPLAQWKTTKGIPAEIITTGAIDRNYVGDDQQERIKNCIKYYYDNKGLEYVLLGGDDSIVPVRGCYGNVNGEHLNNIPTDLYYASLNTDHGENFEWDDNQNNIYGEVADNINLNPDISLTRLPVKSVQDVTNYISKLLEYEKQTGNTPWSQTVLFAGSQLTGDMRNGYSFTGRAAVYGEEMRNLYFRYWNDYTLFYDDFTTLTGGANYDFNAVNLAEQISNGYSFMSVYAHGVQDGWKMEDGSWSGAEFVQDINNPSKTIISTIACNTNAFDRTNPDYQLATCLSEAFIRQVSTGVVAYLGCSRKGWGGQRGTNSYGASWDFEKSFYSSLFTSSISSRSGANKHFGKTVAQSKISMTGNCTNDGSYRWVLFGLNPIGDAEMPVFEDTPQEINITWSSLTPQYNVVFDTPQYGYSVCVMSLGDDGQSYYRVIENSTNTHFSFTNIPADSVQICITKPGYIPRIYKKTLIPLSRETITYEYVNPTTINVRVNVPASATQAYVQASNLSGTTVRRVDLPIIGGEQTVTLTGLMAGVNVITYVVDGVVQDTIQVFM